MEEPKRYTLYDSEIGEDDGELGEYIRADDPAYQSILHKAKMMEKLERLLRKHEGMLFTMMCFEDGEIQIGHAVRFDCAPTLTEAIEKIQEE